MIDNYFKSAEKAIADVQKEFDSYQRDWFPSRSPEFFCLELNGEAGELANLEKKSWKGKTIDYDNFADEAADVLIALMNYSNARGVDLSRAVMDKLRRIDAKRKELNANGMEY